jgi:hypothetical protein
VSQGENDHETHATRIVRGCIVPQHVCNSNYSSGRRRTRWRRLPQWLQAVVVGVERYDCRTKQNNDCRLQPAAVYCSATAMLQAHSFLWHYLWLAPNVLNSILAVLLWRRGLHRKHPFFLCYLIGAAGKEFTMYAMDISPRIDPITWWRADWVGTIAETLLKFGVVAELLHQLLHSWPTLARTGRNLISAVGAFLIILAAVIAGIREPSASVAVISGFRSLAQTIYFTQAGLMLSIFLLAAYFHLRWERLSFGIALGLGITWSEHLATWALIATRSVSPVDRNLIDFANMATYHACVLLWFYYLLGPQPVALKSEAVLPDHNLDLWNRELERLLQP